MVAVVGVCQSNVTDVQFEPVKPEFEPEPHLCELLLAVRFKQVRIGSVWGLAPGFSCCTRAGTGACV